MLGNLCLAPVVVRRRPRAQVEGQTRALLERVAIARALCMEPPILLFDEPLKRSR